MGEFRLPAPLSLEGDVRLNWLKFKQSFDIYLIAAGFAAEEDSRKIAILLNALGQQAVDLFFNVIKLPAAESKKYDKVIKAFEDYTTPRQNILINSFLFNKRNQHEEEEFEQFYAELCKLVKYCEYGDQEGRMLRDRIVLGIKNKRVQQELLQHSKLTLDKTVEICRSAQLTAQQSEVLNHSQVVSVDTVYKRNKGGNYNKAQFVSNNSKNVNKKSNYQFKNNYNSNSYFCKKCHTQHKTGQCPAHNKICSLCKNLHHFAIGCKFKNKRIHECAVKSDEMQNLDSSSDDDSFCIATIKKIDSIKSNEWYESINVKNTSIKFKIDTGAQVNILPVGVIRQLNLMEKMKNYPVTLEAFGGSQAVSLGSVSINCGYKNINNKLKFIVTEDQINNKNINPILGLDGCLAFKLIQINEIVDNSNNNPNVSNKNKNNCKEKETFINNNLDVFTGIGKFKNKFKLKVNPEYSPVVSPPRRIPLTVKSKLKEKLKQLVQDKIIAPVNNPTGWVSNLVIIEKPNKSLRICLDPINLNKAIIRDYTLIPTFEEIIPKLKDKNLFTVLDLKEGFYNLPLDNKSSDLCGFSTPFGVFKFLRLPFGIKSAPEIFQKNNEINFGDIEGITIYFDDILIATNDNDNNHDKILKKVIERARDLGVKFNKEKVQYKVREVKYFGYLFSKNGYRPDPQYINAILNLKSPTNKRELQKILGMFGYLRRFIPNMSQIASNLFELLKNDVLWQWLPAHETAIQRLKEIISKAPALKVFDSKMEVTVQADSSSQGLGACLLQNDQPVMYASRTLTEAEKKYPQVEKELLSVIFACNRFHNLIYGRNIIVLNDHKPLVSIMNSPLNKIASPRLQRLKLKLFKYSITLKYLKGKDLLIADALSRSSLSYCKNNDLLLTEIVHTVGLSNNLKITKEKQSEFKLQTSKDEALKLVINYHNTGWPICNAKVPDTAKFYYHLQNKITVDDGLVFLNNKIIVPSNLRNYILKQLHLGHFGITKMKNRARQSLYWPRMDQAIEDFVARCPECQTYQKSNQKEPLIQTKIPGIPFEHIAVDFLEYALKSYLVVVDYLSKWIEILPVNNKSSEEVIRSLSQIFATHGYPSKITSDNVPFNSARLKHFAKENDFSWIYTSPRFAQANGQAEKAVHIAKRILQKCNNSQVSLNQALLAYRTLPVAGTSYSPAEILMSRKLKTTIPTSTIQLQPKLIIDKFKKEYLTKQKITKQNFDKNSRERPDFKIGSKALVQRGNKWTKCKVIDTHFNPRSYIIEDDNGTVLRRNKFHLKKCKSEISDSELDHASNAATYDTPNLTSETKPISDFYVTKSGRRIKPPSPMYTPEI